MLDKIKHMIKNTFPSKKDENDSEKVIDKSGKKQNKKVENLVILLVILIITIVAINYIWNTDSKESDKDTKTNTNKVLVDLDNNNDTVLANSNLQDNTEIKLEQTLSQITGVGQTKVMITYSQTSKQVPIYNEDTSQSETQETDTSGGNRKINESSQKKELVYKESNGEKEPIIENIIYPKMEGAIILATGANNPDVKTKIIQAVEALTGLATHKIQVFEMSK